MLTRRTKIAAIRETTYGTDPAMTGANNLMAFGLNLDIKGDILKREILRDTLSPNAHVIGLKECELTFKVELKGVVGSTSIEPEIGLLLSGCGFSSGTVTGTTRVYNLVSNEALMNSLAMKVDKDGNLHKVLGSRGSVKLNLEAGKYGVAEFNFKGLYDPVAAATLPADSNPNTNLPPICYNASFNIAGFSPVCSKAEIDIANDVSRRDSLNAVSGVQAFRITNRTPSMSFDADAVVESSNPFWGDWVGGVVDTFGVQVGSNAGNIVKITGIFQYESNKYGDQDGISKYDCKASLVSSNTTTSNDELVVTFVG